MKKIIFITAITTLFITACKKNNDTPAISLQGKWGLVNTHYLEVDNGATVFEDIYTGIAADYIDFRKDNKVYSYIDGSSDTSAYQLLSNNKVVILGDTYDIQSLSAASAKLYQKDSLNANTYTEITINLKR
jgi:hypothetical protein